MEYVKAKKTYTKGNKTKAKILKVSLRLFAANGYKATTVRDISGAMNMKQSALYNHFSNKDKILETLIENLASSGMMSLFRNKEIQECHTEGKALLLSIGITFKLIGFDRHNEELYKLLMQEMFKNERVREIYNEYFYQDNVKKLATVLFSMMQSDIIKSSDPLLLAHEFLSPLFFYQMQITLLKLDKKSTSLVISMFEKHVNLFWDNIKIKKKETLF